MAVTDLDLGKYKLGWADEEAYVFTKFVRAVGGVWVETQARI